LSSRALPHEFIAAPKKQWRGFRQCAEIVQMRKQASAARLINLHSINAAYQKLSK
jgi:hypothetical protein